MCCLSQCPAEKTQSLGACRWLPPLTTTLNIHGMAWPRLWLHTNQGQGNCSGIYFMALCPYAPNLMQAPKLSGECRLLTDSNEQS